MDTILSKITLFTVLFFNFYYFLIYLPFRKIKLSKEVFSNIIATSFGGLFFGILFSVIDKVFLFDSYPIIQQGIESYFSLPSFFYFFLPSVMVFWMIMFITFPRQEEDGATTIRLNKGIICLTIMSVLYGITSHVVGNVVHIYVGFTATLACIIFLYNDDIKGISILLGIIFKWVSPSIEEMEKGMLKEIGIGMKKIKKNEAIVEEQPK